MIQLVGMLDSPYVRRVAVALLLAEVPFRHRPISLFRHIEAFSQLSPLLKAPSLVLDDGTALVESSVILEYLASLHPALAELAPARAEAPIKAAHATGVALTVAEKAVQVHYERALRAPAERSESWRARIGRQLAIGLAALEEELPQSELDRREKDRLVRRHRRLRLGLLSDHDRRSRRARRSPTLSETLRILQSRGGAEGVSRRAADRRGRSAGRLTLCEESSKPCPHSQRPCVRSSRQSPADRRR